MERLGHRDGSTLSLLNASRVGALRDRDGARERLVERYQAPLTRWALVRSPDGCADPAAIARLVRQTLQETIDYVAHLPESEVGSFHWRLREALQNRLDDVSRLPVSPVTPQPPSALAATLSGPDLERYERALRRMDGVEKEVITSIELGLSLVQIAVWLGERDGARLRAATGQAILKLAAMIGAEEKRETRTGKR